VRRVDRSRRVRRATSRSRQSTSTPRDPRNHESNLPRERRPTRTAPTEPRARGEENPDQREPVAGVGKAHHPEPGQNHEGEVARRALAESAATHSGPRNSMATAPPKGNARDGLVETLIHERGRDAQRERPDPLTSRPVTKFRASGDEQDDRAREESARRSSPTLRAPETPAARWRRSTERAPRRPE
jgi:hypothetical protein